jgi:hypothetical protein
MARLALFFISFSAGVHELRQNPQPVGNKAIMPCEQHFLQTYNQCESMYCVTRARIGLKKCEIVVEKYGDNGIC